MEEWAWQVEPAAATAQHPWSSGPELKQVGLGWTLGGTFLLVGQ